MSNMLVLTCLTFKNYCINTQKYGCLSTSVMQDSELKNWLNFSSRMWILIELDKTHRKLNWNFNDRKRHLMTCNFTTLNTGNSKIYPSNNLSIHPYIYPSVHQSNLLSIHKSYKPSKSFLPKLQSLSWQMPLFKLKLQTYALLNLNK